MLQSLSQSRISQQYKMSRRQGPYIIPISSFCYGMTSTFNYLPQLYSQNDTFYFLLDLIRHWMIADCLDILAIVSLIPQLPSPKTENFPGDYPSTEEAEYHESFDKLRKGEEQKLDIRHLLFDSHKTKHEIGRASSNPTKGVNAATNNGYFKAPVMSRRHAQIEMFEQPVRFYNPPYKRISTDQSNRDELSSPIPTLCMVRSSMGRTSCHTSVTSCVMVI